MADETTSQPATTEDAPPPTPSELVQQLIDAREWPDPEILEKIAGAGESAVEPLLAFIQTYPRDEDGMGALFHGLGILIRLRTPAAIPVAVEVIKRYTNDTGDMADMAAHVLGGLGTAGFEAALELLRDPEITGYRRLKVIFAARLAAGDDPAMKARIAEVVRPMLVAEMERSRAQQRAALEARVEDDEASNGEGEDDLGEDDSDLEEYAFDDIEWADPSDRGDSDASTTWTVERDRPDELVPDEEVAFLASELADLADPEALDLIRTAYAEKLIDSLIIDEPFVEEQYREGGESIHPTWDWLDEYNKRYREHIEYLNRPPAPLRPAYRSDDSSDLPQPPPAQETIRNTGPKLGRNDPCWCGSGKKYKKCHLQTDDRT